MKRGLAAVLALSAWAAVVPAAGRAATAAPFAQGDDPAIVLRSIPPSIPASGRARVDIVATGGDDLVVDVSVHAPVGSRIEFERTLTGRSLGRVVATAASPVGELPGAPGGARRIRVDLGPPAEDDATTTTAAAGDEGDEPGEPEYLSLPVASTGVHPVTIALRDGDEVVDRLVTQFVVLERDAVQSPLAVAWIWPFDVAHALTPDGTPSADLVEAVTDDGRLAALVEALGGARGVPITLAPRPATLDAWGRVAQPVPASRPGGDDAPEGTVADTGVVDEAAAHLTSLQREAGRRTRQLVAATYAEADLTALAAAGLEGEIAAQVTTGADTVRSALGLRPDPRTFLAGDLDDAVLAELRRAGVDRLVVKPESLVPVFENLTPAQPFEIRGPGRTYTAAVGDPGLAALATASDRGEGDAVVAQRLIAGLSVVALEAPGLERGVVVVPGSEWAPSAGALRAILDGLARSPALDPVTVDEYFEQIPVVAGENAVRRLVERDAPELAVDPDEVVGIRHSLAAVHAMTDGGPAAALAERLLLLAESADFRGESAEDAARAYLLGARRQIDAAVAAVHLPGRHNVTLTSRRAHIPVTFQNASAEPIRVRVHLRSDKLSFPEGATHDVVLEPRNNTLQFVVEARTSGAFPMLIEVTSPDGALSLGTIRLTVRSTAVSGAALAVTVGAGVFLVGWWGNHIRRARKARRARAAEEEA